MLLFPGFMIPLAGVRPKSDWHSVSAGEEKSVNLIVMVIPSLSGFFPAA